VLTFGCGGRAVEESGGNSAGASSSTGSAARPNSNAGGPNEITIGGLPGCAGTNCSGGVGGGSSAAGVDGGAPNPDVLVACAPAAGGAQPPPLCTTEYTLGLPCNSATFQICAVPSYQAVIWCGRAGFCAPPPDAGPYNLPNPCEGPCDTIGATCQYAVNQSGGGVSNYMCCADVGGPMWLMADCDVN
jgi:hypothetical protein